MTVVKEIMVQVTDQHISEFIEQMNRDVYEDEGEQFLTVEEVVGNDRLLTYVCEQAVADGVALYDPLEFWNADGWCDWKDYR